MRERYLCQRSGFSSAGNIAGVSGRPGTSLPASAGVGVDGSPNSSSTGDAALIGCTTRPSPVDSIKEIVGRSASDVVFAVTESAVEIDFDSATRLLDAVSLVEG